MSNTLADYSVGLVLLSYLVSVIGSLVGLFVASALHREGERPPLGWLALAAFIFGGCAIWSMHFIGILAWQPGVPVYFDTVVTAISLLIPVVFTFIGLLMAFRGSGRVGSIFLAGIIMGAGVASMHYTGMAALRIEAVLSHDQTLVAISVLIAIAASTAALYIVTNIRGLTRYLSALVMGLAVCGMHYTGMAALQVQDVQVDVDFFTQALPRDTMMFFTILTFSITCLVGTFLGATRRLR